MLSSIFVTHLLNLTHKSMNNATTQSHIVWLDVIRTVAMLMVIGVHRSFLYLTYTRKFTGI